MSNRLDRDEKTCYNVGWSYMVLRHTFIRQIEERTVIVGDCYIYNGPITTSGYGLFFRKGRQYVVHRLSGCLFHGVDYYNRKIQVCHKRICLHKRCWNPEHLYAGTASSNMQDRTYFERLGRNQYCRKLVRISR